jgi:hypothetical protein
MKKETTQTLVNSLRDSLDTGFLPVNDGVIKDILEACKKLLIFKGYKVVDPIKKVFNVRHIDDLIALFYAFLDYKHPELAGTHRNLKKDRAIAKRFLEGRMEVGSLNKELALDECAQIIKTIFDREQDFNFTIPLSFEIFGQQVAGWITKKAVELMNEEREGRLKKITEEIQEKHNREYLKKHGEESLGFDVDELLRKMEKEND